jgi:hypothetical protein
MRDRHHGISRGALFLADGMVLTKCKIETILFKAPIRYDAASRHATDNRTFLLDA